MSYLLLLYPEDAKEKGWGKDELSAPVNEEAKWATRERSEGIGQPIDRQTPTAMFAAKSQVKPKGRT
jgi:hypothetical protein